MVSKIVITESFLLEAFSTLSSPKRVFFVTPKCDFKTFYQIVKYLISSKWYRKKGDETDFLFSAEVTVESVFTVTQWTIWFETLQASEKSEENEMLQKTHRYTTTYSSLKWGLCGAPFASYFPKVSYNFIVELCKNVPCLCTNMLWDVHQYGNR